MEPLTWGPERKQAFGTVKKALMTALALDLQDYTKPFYLHRHERKGVVSGVNTQQLRPHQRTVSYYSAKLDPVVSGTPQCTRAIVTASEMVEKSHSWILGHQLYVLVPHEVEILLN